MANGVIIPYGTWTKVGSVSNGGNSSLTGYTEYRIVLRLTSDNTIIGSVPILNIMDYNFISYKWYTSGNAAKEFYYTKSTGNWIITSDCEVDIYGK